MGTAGGDETTASLAVPPVGATSHTWRVAEPRLYSRAELKRQTGAYASAVPATLADWVPEISVELMTDVEDATRALIDFDRLAVIRLGAESNRLAPMSAILLRTESASSSQIENLTVSAKQLALAELGVGDSPNSRTVVGNVRAMETAVALADELSVESLLSMHRALLAHQRGMESHAGALRDELVWIGRGNAGPRTAEFVAPQAALVPISLDDLLAFTARSDLPLLVQIAVAHAQFETIHPFVDGNGRTGRALVQAMLKSGALATHTTIPLSAGLLTDVDGYFAALSAYRNGDAAPIVRTFTAAARFAAAAGGDLLDALSLALNASLDRMSDVRPQASARRLLPLLVGQPVVDSAFVQAALRVDAVTANRALATLASRGILDERTGRRRGRVWEHSGILEALEDFGRGLRRNGR